MIFLYKCYSDLILVYIEKTGCILCNPIYWQRMGQGTQFVGIYKVACYIHSNYFFCYFCFLNWSILRSVGFTCRVQARTFNAITLLLTGTVLWLLHMWLNFSLSSSQSLFKLIHIWLLGLHATEMRFSLECLWSKEGPVRNIYYISQICHNQN